MPFEIRRTLALSTEEFRCIRCRRMVGLRALGTAHRNHCPHCLWSRHLDVSPGDRRAECGAKMEPVAVTLDSGGEWAVIHRCLACGVLHANRVAGDDNLVVLMALAARPLAAPPVPMEYLPGP